MLLVSLSQSLLYLYFVPDAGKFIEFAEHMQSFGEMSPELCPFLGSHLFQFVLVVVEGISGLNGVGEDVGIAEEEASGSVSLVLLQLEGTEVVFEHFISHVQYFWKQSYLVVVGLSHLVVGPVGEYVSLRGVAVEINEQNKFLAVLLFQFQTQLFQGVYLGVCYLVLAVETSV